MQPLHIVDLCLDYRDDILFRVFALDENRYDAWILFCLLPPNKKNANHIEKLMEMLESVNALGQLTPIKAVMENNRIYPAMGASRIASIIHLGKRLINVELCSEEEAPKWNKSWKVDSKYFEGLPAELLDEFLAWKAKFNAAFY